MKKYICGLITGLILAFSLSAFAGTLNVVPNPYPVLVNGSKADVDGYNINGSTYLSLNDAAEALSASVKFNSANKSIEISNSNKVPLKDLSVPEIDHSKEYLNSVHVEKDEAKETTYGKYKAIEYNGSTYVSRDDLWKLKHIYIKHGKLGVREIYKLENINDSNSGKLILKTKNADPINYVIYRNNYIDTDYYNIDFLGKYLED